MRNHHSFGAGRRAARVVDGQQVTFIDHGAPYARTGLGHQGLVIEPAVARTVERHKVRHTSQMLADSVHRVEIVAVCAHDGRAAVLDEIAELVGHQTIVDRHEHCPDLRYRVERCELRVSVRRDVGYAVALTDPERL